MAGEASTLPGAAPKEALARAAFTDKDKLGAAVAGEAASVTKARQLHEALERQPDALAADVLKEETEKNDPISAERGKIARERNIGAGRNKKGELPRTATINERGRDERAKKALTLLDDLDKKGYDGLDDPIKAEARGLIISFINSNATLSLEYPDDASRAEAAEFVLKSASFRKRVRGLYEGRTGTVIEDSVTAAKRRMEAAEKKKLAKDREAGEVQGELEERQEKQRSYDSGDDATELSRLQGIDFDSQRRVTNTDVNSMTRRVRDLAAERDLLDPADVDAVGAKQGEVDTANNKLKELNDKLKKLSEDEAKLARMKEEKAKLPDRIRELKKEKARLEGEQADTDMDFDSAGEEYTQAFGAKNSAEEAWVASLENIIGDASKEFYNERVGVLAEADHAELVKMAAELPDKAKAGMADFVDQRYFSPRTPGRFDRNKSRVELNGKKAATDVALMLNPKAGYPEAAVREGLAKMVSDGTITVAEMQAKSNDPAFIAEQSRLIAKHALATHMRSGGKLTENESFYIQQQPWGNELIDEALEHSASNRDMLAKLDAAGKLKKSRRLPLALIMLFLGGVGGSLKGEW